MNVKTAILSYEINSAGLDVTLEDMINEKLKELNITSDNLIDIKVTTNYCGDDLYHRINHNFVEDSEIIVRYTATIIYKTEE